VLPKCLSNAGVVVSLCGPVATRLRTGKSARSPSSEELLKTSHLRAQCRLLYRRVPVFCNASAMF
jgi:hypothetical protein